MKKVVFILIVAFIAVGFYFQKFFTKFNLPTETQNVTIDGKVYKLLVADNEIEHTNGLMNVRKLSDADGMVFLFDKPKIQIFWNQNTLVDLDVYWMNGNAVVGHDYLPSIEKTKSTVIIQSSSPVDKVVEIIRK